MKRIIIFCLCFLSFSPLAFSQQCSPAASIHDASFCASFSSAVGCNCTNQHYPSLVCSSMAVTYGGMLAQFHSLQRACEYEHNQHGTSYQECLDDWSCYETGKDSLGNICNPTGKAC